MPKRSEKSITKGILKYLNSIPGCYAKKRLAGPTRKGEPDITGCYRGKRLEIEVKALGNTCTPLQKERLRIWESFGAMTGVAYNEDDAKEIMNKGLAL